MIHPQYWSVDSIYRYLTKRSTLLGPGEIRAYSSLNVKDKTVLDVGAWKGDSALFFLRRGAKKVICVEPEKEYAKFIKNIQNCEVINERFSLKHLKIPHDCLKVDIEGWEYVLLKFKAYELKPCVVEVHGQPLWQQFAKKGWHLLFNTKPEQCCAYFTNFIPGGFV